MLLTKSFGLRRHTSRYNGRSVGDAYVEHPVAVVICNIFNLAYDIYKITYLCLTKSMTELYACELSLSI